VGYVNLESEVFDKCPIIGSSVASGEFRIIKIGVLHFVRGKCDSNLQLLDVIWRRSKDKSSVRDSR